MSSLLEQQALDPALGFIVVGEPVCEDGSAPTADGCPNPTTFSDPLCSDGNPAPSADGCPNDDGTFSNPLCSDGNPAPSAGWLS